MIVLLHKSPGHVARFSGRKIGRLISPRGGHGAVETHELGLPWAADNDAYSGFDAKRYVRMLDALAGVPGCLFCTCPDVVGDARATIDLFYSWREIVAATGMPVGLVAQDGLSVDTAPWDDFDALFVGGTTGFKYSPAVIDLSHEAHERGKWLHFGRVNTMQRATWAASVGADSFDGTGLSRFTNTKLPRMLDHLDALATPQMTLLKEATPC